LSPIQSAEDSGAIGVNGEIPDIRSLRIPLRYLANLLTAGDEALVSRALERLLGMRAYYRRRQLDGVADRALLERIGLTETQVEEMYRYLALACFEDRFVIPTSHREYASATFDAYGERGGCGFSFGNGCSDGAGRVNLFGGKSLTARKAFPIRISVERKE